MYVLVTAPLPTSTCLTVKESVLVYVHRDYSWKIPPKDARLSAPQAMLNPQPDIVLLNALATLKHMPTLMTKYACTNV